MRKVIHFLLVITGLLAFSCPLLAQIDEQGRIDLLEKQVRTLQNTLEQLNASTKQPEIKFEGKKVTPMNAFWKNGLYLSTADEKMWMKIGGNLHADFKAYGGSSNNPTHFDIRRARFDFQGVFYESISFRCQVELADSPYARNFWVDYEFSDALHLRVGQMKPPFSTSWWTTDNNVHFLERAAGTPMYTYFDRGWWLWGDLINKTLTWNLGAFTGAGMDYDYKKGDIDDHKDWVGRLFFTPFKNTDKPMLKGLSLVIEGTIGDQSVISKRFEGGGYSGAVRDDAFWTWTGVGQKIDSRRRWGGEIHYIAGPFSLSSEYLVTQWKDIQTATGSNYDGDVASSSTWISFFLTGETKQVSNSGWKQPNPKSNFDIASLTGSGAWEILARYTRTKTDETLFENNILKGADTVDEYTIGLSWTWNPMIRWQLNYVHIHGNRDGIRTGSDDNAGGKAYVENEDMAGLRMIFKF